jgi:hypothetical protein
VEAAIGAVIVAPLSFHAPVEAAVKIGASVS